jgi:hypothetical protein
LLARSPGDEVNATIGTATRVRLMITTWRAMPWMNCEPKNGDTDSAAVMRGSVKVSMSSVS